VNETRKEKAMAKVTVRVKMDRAFMVYCEGKNAEEAMENICDKRIQAPELAEACYEVMEVEEGTYDGEDEYEKI
jgi:hypothetical protein